MQRQTTAVLPRYVDYGILYVAAFELDVNRGPIAHSLEDIAKSGDPVAAAEIDLRDLAPGGLRDHSSLNGVVVVDDDLAVFGGMDVELDGIRTVVDGEQKTRQRVLGS